MAPGVGLPPAFNLIQSRSSVSLNVDITLADLAPLLLRNISCSFASVLAQTSSTNRSLAPIISGRRTMAQQLGPDCIPKEIIWDF